MIAGGFKPQFLPALDGISTLFSRLTTAASLWVHLVAINLFAGCKTYIEGGTSSQRCAGCLFTLQSTLPSIALHAGRNRQLPTRHTTFLCMLFGPLGILSSILTEVGSQAPAITFSVTPPKNREPSRDTLQAIAGLQRRLDQPHDEQGGAFAP